MTVLQPVLLCLSRESVTRGCLIATKLPASALSHTLLWQDGTAAAILLRVTTCKLFGDVESLLVAGSCVEVMSVAGERTSLWLC